MNRLVEKTAEDSGVWQVVACASQHHARRLEEMERMRTENDSLKLRGVGEFKDEGNRKRPRDEASGVHTNVWDDFASDVMNGKAIPGVI